ncbi:hypothetical protein [Gordonia sp. YY1]|uniref:hypothetical protein n=1 Tax=Gordonia sp. YY1 TaxID=396712 RepID=UPI0013311B20|nr:hypothetical protein [Gordonia sp. YY1]KAF0969031.1 hypothetical protein BPODLACK_02261 [Gordonia sp. YY1]
MRNALRSISFSFLGYLGLLLAFALMGLFVVTLAGGVAGPAWPFGTAMAVLFALSFTSFRFQILLSDQSRDDDDLIVSSDPMTPPLRRADVERYERTYRTPTEATEIVPSPKPTRLVDAA